MKSASEAESIEVENVVASSHVDQEVELDELGTDLAHTEYDPEQFPGLIYRLDEPDATVLIFRSGQIVCTGADSVPAVRTAITQVIGTLREIGIQAQDPPDISVQNIVSSTDLGAALNLNAIAIGLGLESVEYEPEQFPGLVYRLDDPDVVALLFGSGKTVITGARDIMDAEQGAEVIEEQLADLGLLD